MGQPSVAKGLCSGCVLPNTLHLCTAHFAGFPRRAHELARKVATRRWNRLARPGLKLSREPLRAELRPRRWPRAASPGVTANPEPGPFMIVKYGASHLAGSLLTRPALGLPDAEEGGLGEGVDVDGGGGGA